MDNPGENRPCWSTTTQDSPAPCHKIQVGTSPMNIIATCDVALGLPQILIGLDLW